MSRVFGLCLFTPQLSVSAIVFICVAYPFDVPICRATFEPSLDVEFVEFYGLAWSPTRLGLP